MSMVPVRVSNQLQYLVAGHGLVHERVLPDPEQHEVGLVPAREGRQEVLLGLRADQDRVGYDLEVTSH